MERMCLLVVLLVLSEAAKANVIIFPGQLDHAEGDACLTHSGGTGICSQSCEHPASLRDPVRCGIKDSTFLVCCNKSLARVPGTLTDISPPSVTFQCGKNARTSFFSVGFSFGNVLRPEPRTPPTEIIEVEVSRPVRSIPGEILPEEGIPEFSTAEGVGGVNALKNAWPWMALIGEKDGEGIRWFCGGVLINEQWILSALHCFFYKWVNFVQKGQETSTI